MDKNKMFGFCGVARTNQTFKMELFAKIINGFTSASFGTTTFMFEMPVKCGIRSGLSSFFHFFSSSNSLFCASFAFLAAHTALDPLLVRIVFLHIGAFPRWLFGTSTVAKGWSSSEDPSN